MAFLCDGGWVTKVVIDHRHEDEIGAAVAKRNRLCQSLAVDHVSDCRLTASLIEHLHRWVDADHLDTEMRRQQFGKTPGATTFGPINMNREQVLPEPDLELLEEQRDICLVSDAEKATLTEISSVLRLAY
jgi:hypothetical protein